MEAAWNLEPLLIAKFFFDLYDWKRIVPFSRAISK
jgi:hypothetical protein